MLRKIFFSVLICLLLCACESNESSKIPNTQITNIKRTILNENLNLSLYFEIPIFHEKTLGYKKINSYFKNLEKKFFSQSNESLISALEYAKLNSDEIPFRYENTAIVHTKSEKLLSVSINTDWWMGGINDKITECYNFSPSTGEILKLSDLIDEPESEILNKIYKAAKEKNLDLTEIKTKSLDDFNFYIKNQTIIINYEKYFLPISTKIKY